MITFLNQIKMKLILTNKPITMKKITLLIASAIIISCAAPIKGIPYKHESYSLPLENETIQKEIGSTLVLKGDEYTQEAYVITSSPEFSITLIKYPYGSGHVLPLSGETENWYLYYPKENLSTGSVAYIAGVAKHKTIPNKILPFMNSTNGFTTKEVEGFNVKEGKYSNPDCQNCFKKEFIYNGKTGTGLKFIYREYINDMARPAFNQDLQYDLADGNVVGFKGLRIEVIKATNTSIEYKIIKTFD